MVASLWGMRCVDDLDFFLISCTPTDPTGISHTCYPPISPVPIHGPYFPKLPHYLYTSTWGSLFVALWCSGSMLASHARGPGFNPRAG